MIIIPQFCYEALVFPRIMICFTTTECESCWSDPNHIVSNSTSGKKLQNVFAKHVKTSDANLENVGYHVMDYEHIQVEW